MTTPTTIDVHLESLKLAIDNSPDIASILDREGKLVFVNQRISVLGYEQDELIGVSVRDLIHPADWPVVEAGLNMLGASEAPEESVEYRWKTKSGDWRYLESRGRTYALKDFFGYLISSRDVTEQHILVDELRSASELFKTTFDLSRNLVSVTRAGTGEILNVNEQWLRAAGFTREEVIGKTTVEIGVWGGKDRRNDMMENLSRDDYVRNFQTYSFTKTGRYLPIIQTSSTIRPQSNERGAASKPCLKIMNMFQDTTIFTPPTTGLILL